MHLALWIVAGLLAAVFLGAGGMKLAKGRAGLAADPRMAWAQDFSAGGVAAIGTAEVLGALGLVLPAVTGIAVALVPAAAAGLALTMVGAVIVHLRRGERQALAGPVVLGLLAAFVAWGRSGPYPI